MLANRLTPKKNETNWEKRDYNDGTDDFYSAIVFATLLVFSISIPLTEYSREDFSFFTLFFTGMFVAFIIASYVNYKNR